MGNLVRRYYAIVFVDNLNFTLPIWLLFGVDYLHLSFVQAVIVTTVPYMAVGGILQVPCGA